MLSPSVQILYSLCSMITLALSASDCANKNKCSNIHVFQNYDEQEKNVPLTKSRCAVNFCFKCQLKSIFYRKFLHTFFHLQGNFVFAGLHWDGCPAFISLYAPQFLFQVCNSIYRSSIYLLTELAMCNLCNTSDIKKEAHNSPGYREYQE